MQDPMGFVADKGLSPRVRGNLTSRTLCPVPVGSIPACAGEPVLVAGGSGRCGVYPRVCGGTYYMVRVPTVVYGLSPRVRGNPVSVAYCLIPSGSIPACAGEPCGLILTQGYIRVYPRVCGGTLRERQKEWGEAGLSPRVRGNPVGRRDTGRGFGSIPACAGEPESGAASRSGGRVYPRVCGGTCVRPKHCRLPKGLSPRVRGNPSYWFRLRGTRRSIPACAGEPRVAAQKVQDRRVYPRVCGGTQQGYVQLGEAKGLSPRVRGNPIRTQLEYPISGSIPACAGEPDQMDAATRAHAVYPRVCGGTNKYPVSSPPMYGLSPRVRGNRGF